MDGGDCSVFVLDAFSITRRKHPAHSDNGHGERERNERERKGKERVLELSRKSNKEAAAQRGEKQTARNLSSSE